jgi:hypothetical protein
MIRAGAAIIALSGVRGFAQSAPHGPRIEIAFASHRPTTREVRRDREARQ